MMHESSDTDLTYATDDTDVISAVRFYLRKSNKASTSGTGGSWRLKPLIGALGDRALEIVGKRVNCGGSETDLYCIERIS